MSSPIADALKALQVRIAERDEFRSFYRGDQGVHLRSPELRRALKGHRGFAVNFCKVITDALTDRIQVRGIEAQTPDTDDATDTPGDELIEKEESNDATDAVDAIWKRSALDVTMLAWRYSVDGDAYVGLELDTDADGNVTAVAKAIDGDMVAPLDDGSLFVMTGEDEGMLVDTDGSVTAYTMVAGGEWSPVTMTVGEGDESETVIAKTIPTHDGTPEGIPLRVIERIRNGDDGTRWGTSDQSVAVPQQRAINARAVDIHEVSGNAAWPQNWLTGPGAAKAAGRVYSRAGAVHGLEGADLQLQQFAAADPTKLSATLDGLIEYLSVTSGTPLQSGSTGANSSAESRRIAQDKLTRRVMKALDALATAIARILESALLAETGIEATIEISWESPEPVAEKDALETATMKLALGVSRHTLLGELGYNAKREAALRADERAEEQVSMTRAVTTGTDTVDDITNLLNGANGTGTPGAE